MNNEPKTTFHRVRECLYRYGDDGCYYAKFKIGGHRVFRSLQTTDFEFAKRKLRVFRNEQQHIDRDKEKTTMRNLCDRYLDTIRHQSPITIAGKTRTINRIKRDWPGGADTQVGKIKPSDCDAWLAKYSVGAPTRNGHMLMLKRLFESARRDRIITTSPAEHLTAVKRAKPIRLTPTFEQFKAIIADVRAQRLNPDPQTSGDFLEAEGLLGLGQGELSALKREHIDLDAGRIQLFRRKTKTPFFIPIYPQACALLERLCAGKAHDEHIFPTYGAKKALTHACKRLNFPAFSQRSLRRMFITRCIEKGIDVKVIADWQGHADGGKLILSTYSHVRPEHAWKMAQRLTTEVPENVVPMNAAAENGQ
jgi:integrase